MGDGAQQRHHPCSSAAAMDIAPASEGFRSCFRTLNSTPKKLHASLSIHAPEPTVLACLARERSLAMGELPIPMLVTCTCRQQALDGRAPAECSQKYIDSITRQTRQTYADAITLAQLFDSDAKQRPRVASEAALSALLGSLDRERLLANLQPELAEQRARRLAADKGCPTRRPRVAIVLVGALRTMLTMADEFAAVFAELRQLSSALQLFAVLSWRDEQRPPDGWSRNAFGQIARKPAREGGNRSAAPPSRAAVEATIAKWGMPFELSELDARSQEAHSTRLAHACPGLPIVPPGECERFPFPGVPHGCTRVQVQLQFVRVAAATALLEAAERREGHAFDVVIRLRPDLCLKGALPLLRFAVERTRCDSLVALHALDALLVYPRWAADAYANYWRSGPNCTRPSWALGCGMENEKRALVGWLQREAGLVAFNLHQVTEEVGWTSLALRRPWLACESFMIM